jgi:amino acid adenylation domain-containing protein
MLEDAGAPVLITEERLLGRLPDAGVHIICLDRDREQIDREPSGNPEDGPSPACVAYIVYTSGSTGRPRGVLVPHRSAAWYARTAAGNYGIGPTDRVLQLASLGFDISVEEIYPCLSRGATLVVADPLSDFLETCRAWHITVLCMATAFWNVLTSEAAAHPSSFPPSLRLVCFGGEKVSPERVAQWRDAVGQQAVLLNSYGPTETTVVASLHRISCEPASQRSEIPIGRPIADVAVRVLAGGEPVPVGVAGELSIGGAGVARGYLGLPELTAERFVPDPFSRQPGARLYRTGDRARWRPNGELEFLGRLDEQVKVRGFRVELGEVESAIAASPGVQEAVVLAREDAQGLRRLVAYVVPAPGAGDPVPTLRAQLYEVLPDYMVPSAFLALEALPLTTNGKVDRKALPAPQWRSAHDYQAPGSSVEKALAAIWTEVLGLERVGIRDNFFDLGGHSLTATQVVARIWTQLDLRVPVRELFLHPTIESLATLLEQEMLARVDTDRLDELLALVEGIGDIEEELHLGVEP